MPKTDYPFEPSQRFEKFLEETGFLKELKPYETPEKMDLAVLKDSMKIYAAFWILKFQKDKKNGKESKLLTSDFEEEWRVTHFLIKVKMAKFKDMTTIKDMIKAVEDIKAEVKVIEVAARDVKAERAEFMAPWFAGKDTKASDGGQGDAWNCKIKIDKGAFNSLKNQDSIMGVLSQHEVLIQASGSADRVIKRAHIDKSNKVVGWCFSTHDSVRLCTDGPKTENEKDEKKVNKKPTTLFFNQVVNVK